MTVQPPEVTSEYAAVDAANSVTAVLNYTQNHNRPNQFIFVFK